MICSASLWTKHRDHSNISNEDSKYEINLRCNITQRAVCPRKTVLRSQAWLQTESSGCSCSPGQHVVNRNMCLWSPTKLSRPRLGPISFKKTEVRKKEPNQRQRRGALSPQGRQGGPGLKVEPWSPNSAPEGLGRFGDRDQVQAKPRVLAGARQSFAPPQVMSGGAVAVQNVSGGREGGWSAGFNYSFKLPKSLERLCR